MFFFVWRGYGLLGIVPPMLGMAALGFLTDYSFMAALLGGVLVLAATGAPLAVAGWWLNRYGNFHSLYGVPLWTWGALYVVVGLGSAAWVAYSVSQHGWTN